MRFFINTSFDPAFNLALEELLFKEFPEELFMLWRNRSAVIVGKNQNTLAEVDHHFAEANDIAIVRRITGGGAVYHDLGNVNYSLLVQERQPGPDSFAHFAKPVVEALQKMGINAAFSGRNDIEVDGKKISGSAQCCFQNRTLFHGTLLFEINMELLSKVLTPRQIKLESKGVRSVRARVGNLKELLPDMDVEEFIEAFAKQFAEFAGTPEPVPLEWCQRAENLAEERYRQPEWNWGGPFECTWENSAKFSAGVVEIKLRAQGGCIEEIHIQGDFFGEASVLEESLKGALFHKSAVEERLKTVEVKEHIKGLTKKEFLSLFNL